MCRELSDFWDRKETSRHESPCITIRVGRGGAGPDSWGLLGTLLALWDSDFFCRVRAFGASPASGSWILKRPALQPAHGVLFAFSLSGWHWFLSGNMVKRNLRNETCEAKSAKRNLRNETCEAKPAKRNLRNETCEAKPASGRTHPPVREGLRTQRADLPSLKGEVYFFFCLFITGQRANAVVRFSYNWIICCYLWNRYFFDGLFCLILSYYRLLCVLLWRKI